MKRGKGPPRSRDLILNLSLIFSGLLGGNNMSCPLRLCYAKPSITSPPEEREEPEWI